jgi:UDP-glucuronate 4-epimerase
MKILVTGAAGFIGSYVAQKLTERLDEVVGLDNINNYYDPAIKYERLKKAGIIDDLEEGEHIPYGQIVSSADSDNYLFVKINLEDKEEVFKIFENEKFDAVCHLAAQAGVRYSLENPDSYINSNIIGFMNILEACRHYKVKNLSFASSSSVYGLNDQFPSSTSHNTDYPISLYAATKKSNELIAHVYSHLFGIQATGMRFFTCYGPWDRPDMAAFKFVKAAIEGNSIDVYNNGHMYRDFTKIIDKPACPVPGNAKQGLFSSFAPYKIYNIGNNNPIKLIDFIAAIEKKLEKKIKKNMRQLQAGDVLKTNADISDIVQELGYKPLTHLQDGVNKYVDWFLEYQARSKCCIHA